MNPFLADAHARTAVRLVTRIFRVGPAERKRAYLGVKTDFLTRLVEEGDSSVAMARHPCERD
jgi:hypothetical protein